MMAVLLLCSLLLPLSLPAQVQVATVHIRVLNGRTEKPVKRAETSITVTPGAYATPLDRKTDLTGRLAFLVPSGTEIHTLVLRYANCRSVPKADRKHQVESFPTGQILAGGIVSENSCSQRTISPTPGELTLFVRPMHWWERIRN